jgi:hypothetical protein
MQVMVASVALALPRLAAMVTLAVWRPLLKLAMP